MNVDGATTLGKPFGCALYTCACHAIRRLAAEAQAIQQHLDVDEAELVSVHKIVEAAAKENASLRADNDSLRKQLVREQLQLAHNIIGSMLEEDAGGGGSSWFVAAHQHQRPLKAVISTILLEPL